MTTSDPPWEPPFPSTEDEAWSDNGWDGETGGCPGRGGLDQSVDMSRPDGSHAKLRRLVLNLIEEYGRHTGHADLIREAVDNGAGEDPPAGWRP